MVKLTFCLRRLPHLSREEFQAYWRGNHAELAKSLAGDLHFKRYVQCHTQDNPINEAMRKTRGLLEPFDGIAETWYESMEDFNAAANSPEGKAAVRKLREDEANFIDLSRSCGWINEENVVIEG